MKKRNPSRAAAQRPPQKSPAPIEPEIVDEPTALTVKSTRMPKIKGKTPGQRINFLHRLSVASGKLSIAAGIMAGWELTRAKAKCDHGQWLAWLDANTDISPMTATRYMSVYSMTVGAARAALPEPVAPDVAPTPAELNEAAANVDAPTLNGLYKQLRILKGNPDHGGRRENAGRKSKDDAAVAAELKAVAEHESVIWASAKGSLDNLVQLDAGRDMFHRLSGDHLATVAGLLADLSKKAAAALEQRLSGKITATMDTAEAVGILEKGL